MRAAFIDGKELLEVRTVADPEPGDGEVLIRVAAVGICGSDLHYYFEGANGEYVVREPLIPGHELSGTVAADPSGRLAPGTPVTVHPARFGTPEPGLEDAPHLWPGGSYLGSASTWPHTQGAMSELLVVRADMVRPLPPGLGLLAAALAEPLGVALHAINRAGGVAGRRVLVSGAGPIGLLALVAARARGATEVVVADVLPEPLTRARALGASGTATAGGGEVPATHFDVVLECSGAPAAISAAGVAVGRAGTVVQVGMVPNEPRGINLAPFVSKEVTLRGTFRFHDEIDDAVDLLARDPGIAAVVTHVFALDDVTDAFATARDARASGKVVVVLDPAAVDGRRP